MYEYEFRQKEMEMMREIAALQSELARNTKLEVLVEKTMNLSLIHI